MNQHIITKDEIFTELTEGVYAVLASPKWKDWLTLQSRLPHYSVSNTLLIWRQFSQATHVAGFNAWLKLDRHVKKGERALWIMAPVLIPQTPREKPLEIPIIRAFRPVPVFDISQTDGAPMQRFLDPLIDGLSPQTLTPLLNAASSIGYRVSDQSLPKGIYGLCRPEDRSIELTVSASHTQRFKTLAHELTHALLHTQGIARDVAELEAESSAFIVCQRYGIVSDDYSFGYVAAWGKEHSIETIRQSYERIWQAANTIMTLAHNDTLQHAI